MSPDPPELDRLGHLDEADPPAATPPDRVTAPPACVDGAGLCAPDAGSVGPDGGGLVVNGALALESDDDGTPPATPAPGAPDC